MRYFLLAGLIALMLVNIGCGGSTLGETGIAHYSDLPSTEISDGWYTFNKGNSNSAQSKFESVLRLEGVTDRQKSVCYTGIGFSESKKNGLIEAHTYFDKALDLYDMNRDAKVGMAGYYLSLSDKNFFQKGIDLLESMGLHSLDKTFVPEYNKELTDKSVHSLLGLLYYYNGNYNDAYVQLRRAQEINEPYPECDIKAITDSFLSQLEGCLTDDGDIIVP